MELMYLSEETKQTLHEFENICCDIIYDAYNTNVDK